MFDRDKMMVSVEYAEEIVQKEVSKTRDKYLDMIKTQENQYEELTSDMIKTINNMKLMAPNNQYYLGFRISNNFAIKNVGFETEMKDVYGFNLHVGDEVEIIKGDLMGKLGVITIDDNNGDIKVKTNAEVLNLSNPFHTGSSNPYSYIAITKHYNELQLGEEIAKGRNGGLGFTVKNIEDLE